MTIALVASTQIASAPSQGPSPGINTTGATLLVGIYTWFGSGNSAPTDTYSNTWSTLTVESGGINAVYWYAFPTSGQVGTGHSFTANVSNAAAQFAAFSGTVQTGYDQFNGGSNTSASDTFQPGSITPSANGALVLSGMCYNTWNMGATVDSGLTITTSNTITGGYYFGAALAYLVQSTAAAINPTWTADPTANQWSGSNVSFLSAGGGGGGGTLDNSGTSIFVIG